MPSDLTPSVRPSGLRLQSLVERSLFTQQLQSCVTDSDCWRSKVVAVSLLTDQLGSFFVPLYSLVTRVSEIQSVVPAYYVCLVTVD